MIVRLKKLKRRSATLIPITSSHMELVNRKELTKQFTAMIVLLILLLLSFFIIQIAFANSTSNCITFNSSKRSIEISCESANLTDIDNQLNNMNILEKQSGTTHHNNNEIWLLKANLIVAKGATFTINSTDTKWLKIYSTEKTAFHIDIYGSMNIDSVKITSWDPKNKTVDKFSNSEPHSRSSIRIAKEATGTTNITNSELAYLGGGASQIHGLSYYGGNGSVIRGNNIHHLEMGFYSDHTGHMLIENNSFHHNKAYGLDPHSGTHDMIIRKNVVHDNGFIGIICSQHCRNIIIEGNEVYNNNGTGIAFSIDMQTSVVRDNYIHDEKHSQIVHIGLAVSNSNNNEIYGNIISNTHTGIGVGGGSSNNYIGNNIFFRVDHAIFVKGSDTINNLFENNRVLASNHTVGLYNNSGSIFRKNDIGSATENTEYSIGRNSTLNIKNSKFYSDIKVKSDHGNNTVNIFNSGIIEVTDNKSTRTYDTDISPFSTKISNEIFIRFIFRDSL